MDRRNRRSQSAFGCLWCGHQMHADLNAARNIGERERAQAAHLIVTEVQRLHAEGLLDGTNHLESLRRLAARHSGTE